MPPGHYPPGEPGQHGYYQPVHQPVMAQQQQYGMPPQGPGRPGGTQAIRTVLIFAAVAGLVTVVIGLIFVLGSPDEYKQPGRQVLKLGNFAPSVGPGGPGQALTQAVPTAPAPVPS